MLESFQMYIYCINMEATIKKWGNSLGLRIPKNLAQGLHIDEGSNVELLLEDDKIVILRKEKISLQEKLDMISPENIHNEFNTGNPVGNEEW